MVDYETEQIEANDEQEVAWSNEACNTCGRRLNSWDIKIAKAVGYTQSFPCEGCLAVEYDMTTNEIRGLFEDHFGLRPCKGI